MVNTPATTTGSAPRLRTLKSYRSILMISQELAKGNLPFQRILELAYRAGGRYCLQWNDSQNVEWTAESKLLYSHVYPQQPSHVIRLDFFSSNPMRPSANTRYIGYVSLRPGPRRTVVDCSILPPVDTRNHYLLCASSLDTKYPVSDTQYLDGRLSGICPFVQQDAVVGVCAHACLRTVSLILEQRFQGCTSLTIDKIHERTATMPLLEGSHIPSTGLAEFELVPAIEAMGAASISYTFVEGRERREGLTLEQLIYPYIESGIPVMVGIETEGESHVIVVVGHVFDEDSWWQQAEAAYFPSLRHGETWIPSYMWVPEFIVQDDNFGPYLSAPRTLLRISTTSVTVPVPQSCHMFLAGHRAETMAAGYLTSEFYEYVLDRTRTQRLWRSVIETAQEEQRVVLRPILITKDTLFQHIEGVKLSQDLSETYKQADLSPWVWFVEVSTPELFSQQQKLGEIILNASYPAQHIQTGMEPLLAIRILDVVVVGADFLQPRVTTDRNPVKVLNRPTFGIQ